MITWKFFPLNTFTNFDYSLFSLSAPSAPSAVNLFPFQ
jgi:hypothetical protein